MTQGQTDYGLDLAIIWKTIFVVFRKPDTAY